MKKIYLHLVIILLLSISNICNAQFQYYQIDTVKESFGSAQTNYQALLEINTQVLVTAGQMQASGADIRFSETCSGAYLDYYIESGMNTANTRI